MRKPMIIDKKTFEDCAKNLCMRAETAGVLGVSESTLIRWCKKTYGLAYQDIAQQFRAKGLAELRKNLFALSKSNPAVAIFLAKNYLGMSDNPVPQDTGESRKEFENAIKTASRALASADISKLAQVPQQDNDHEQNQDKEI